MGHVTAGELVDVYPEAQDSVHCATNLAADVASQLVVTYPVVLLRVQTLASNTMRLNEYQRTLVAFTTLRRRLMGGWAERKSSRVPLAPIAPLGSRRNSLQE